METENTLLKELKKIEKWINESSFIVNGTHLDGRIASLLAEPEILARIEKEFDNITAKRDKENRSFGDMTIVIDNKEFPVNLKLTSENNNSNDNLVGLVGLMCHIFFDGKRVNGHSSIARKIKEGNYSEKYNDYGFISITKETGKCEVSTILSMENYVVNPSNGFQANFNRVITKEKTFEDGRAYILNKYREFLKKKAEAFLILEGMDV